MQLLLLHYNNYFNRIIKKEDTVAAYMNADSNYRVASNVNFNPGDGVNTSLVLGLDGIKGKVDLNIYNGSMYELRRLCLEDDF